ncbi:hypothetical protein ACFWMU_10645 [Streptomyces sp. NPDC058357]|uniref:hypothetical protein n=1 Tax=unclassified Streptomyces TaxID=2593676 RepID=UPI003650C809
MTLHFIAKDPETNGEHCPTVWFDDVAQEFVIQGWKADEMLRLKCLESGPIPDTEDVVRIPARMIDVLKKVIEVAERSPVR